MTPSQQVAVVHNQDDHNRLDLLKWGFVPIWTKDLSFGNKKQPCYISNAPYTEKQSVMIIITPLILFGDIRNGVCAMNVVNHRFLATNKSLPIPVSMK